MKKLILFLLFTIHLVSLHAYNNLRVGDPRNSWSTYPGSITEASMTIKPKGAYLEYGLYMTFSSKGSPWNKASDTLEVVLNFDLPEEAIVIDSWLWIEDEIVQAKILDRWSASSIYEGIVKRRSDPSILKKNSDTQYELRIFPLIGSETRKVKITYLMPATWTKTGVEASLPLYIINTSFELPPDFYVFTWADQVWKNPVIDRGELSEFVDAYIPEFGSYKKASISYANMNKATKIRFDNPMKNGIFLSDYSNGNEGIYQLILNPHYFIETGAIKKVAVLIDYDVSNTNMSQQELLNLIESEMLNQLNPIDSFNLILSNLSITRYSNKWVAATQSNIQSAFNSLNNPLSSYSNLPALLGNGIDFVKMNGKDGKIILISDSDNYGEYSVANTLIKDIMNILDKGTQIHIADYQTISIPNFYFNNQYFYGNDYLYTNLSRLTGSAYNHARNGNTAAKVIKNAFTQFGGAINSFDLHTDMDNGFCYSRYNLNEDNNVTYLDEMIMQVGKYFGTFPFTLEISGEINNTYFSYETLIQSSGSVPSDTAAQKIWSGQYIMDMERSNPTNDIVNSIIYHSIDERVLSRYTAFLCLEDTTLICHSCVDESELVEIEDPEKETEDLVVVYPNPFSDEVTIKLICEEPYKIVELAVYTPSGQRVHVFNTSEVRQGENLIKWDASQMASGMYFLIYKNGSKTKSVKLIKM